MVGPSISDAERSAMRRRLGAAFVLLVAFSGALTGVWAGASPPWIAGFAVGGAVLGGALTLYLSWLGREAKLKASERSRERRPSSDFGSNDERDDESEPARQKRKNRR